MTICTSGDNYSNHNIATNAYEWFNRYTPLEFKQKEIEVHYCDLTDDNVKGWCEQCDDNHWLVTIHNDLDIADHYRTLFHEFQHVIQDIFGVKDDEVRETQAYQIEDTMYNEMCASS